MAKKLQPKLRFKGFTDDWEQQKLGNLGQARSGVGFPIQEQGGKSGIPFFKVSDMNTIGNESEMRHANNYVDISQIQKNGWILITDVPAILFAKVGAAVLLNRKRLVLEPFLLDNNMMEYSISGKAWDVPFAQALFETINLPSLVQTGALPSYNTSDIKSIEVSLPSNTLEQKRIGSFFSSLNKLIAAEQRKLSLLEDKKNAYLQELFSEAFIDQHSWNVTQLEDVASLIKRKNKEQEITCVYTNSAEYGIVPQAQFFDRDIASREHLENYTIIEQNDFIYNPRISKEAPYGPIRRNKNASIGVVSPLYTVFRLKSIDPTFMEYFFQSNIWHKFMQLNGDTGARSDRFAIKDSVFLRMPIAYPTNDAQKRIGAFFQQLDTLIKTETHKIQLLQQKKKGLLQQMFI